MEYKLGAHVSAAGGLSKALGRAAEIGCNCAQVFSTSPRGWNEAKFSSSEVKEFVKEKKQRGIEPVYFHASYLINLADSGKTGHLSKKVLTAELNIASELGVRGSVIHLGSFKKSSVAEVEGGLWDVLIGNIGEVVRKMPRYVLFIIENAGNRKIGQSLDEISRIIKEVNSPNIRVCLDTCHLFSAGYNISIVRELENFLDEFDDKIGLEKLEVVHINDSRDPFASFRDRHENIGEGTLGRETFKMVLNHPKLKHLPFILEVPGFEGEGPDKKNLDILKLLCGEQ